MQGIVLHQGREVEIPCMAKVSLMTTFTLSCSVSLPASRSCRQKNGGGITELAAWTQTGCTPGHTRILWKRGFHILRRHTHLQSLTHNLYKIKATTAIEGKGLL